MNDFAARVGTEMVLTMTKVVDGYSGQSYKRSAIMIYSLKVHSDKLQICCNQRLLQ